ncbi:hypothetical protein NDU88_010946 [Pleurodeles waltl]|uniref:Uncharacterized protein n=1 Tax=Pleurodeles waltl TaxID=8319 RepID=A0AAV7S5H5_PLEWA|nr:hypothetical protein NDU88_010946 [Pleurodeles waltl]
MDRILQEISAVGRRLEGICTLAAETKSIRLDIVGFQAQVMGLELHVTVMEDHLNTTLDLDQELLYLRSKVIDLEDRSRRYNVCFFSFPEQLEGLDVQDFFRTTLSAIKGLHL